MSGVVRRERLMRMGFMFWEDGEEVEEDMIVMIDMMIEGIIEVMIVGIVWIIMIDMEEVYVEEWVFGKVDIKWLYFDDLKWWL